MDADTPSSTEHRETLPLVIVRAVATRIRADPLRALGVVAGIVFVYLLLIGFVLWVTPDTNVTAGGPLPEDQLPNVYSGQVFDIDADGIGDVALFGDVRSPVVHDLGSSPDPVAIAVIPAVFVFLGAILGPAARSLTSRPD